MAGDATSRTGTADPDFDLPERRRTIWIWLILAWSCLSIVNMLFTFGVVLLDLWPSTVPRMTPLQLVFNVMSTAVFFAGCLALFNLRAKAVTLLTVGFAFSVATDVYDAVVLRPQSSALPGTTWIVSGAVIWSVGSYGALLAYVFWLRHRGRLL